MLGSHRQGVGGASFASVELDEGAEERRSTVPAGTPFGEETTEACPELLKPTMCGGDSRYGCRWADLLQLETAARGGSGMELDVSLVPLKEEG